MMNGRTTKASACLALMLLIANVGPSRAAGADPSAQRCRDLIGPITALTVETADPVGSDGCSFAGVRLSLGRIQGWSAERIVVTRLDFDRLSDDQRLPLTLRIEAHGVRFSPTLPNKVSEYIVRTTSRPFDATLDYELPLSGGIFELKEFSMRGRYLGDLHLSGTLADVMPGMLQTPEAAMPTAGVKSLSLHLDNQGFVESFLVAPLAAQILQGSDDPDATVERTRQVAIAALRGTLSGTGTAPATIDALAAFVGAMPHPDKVLDVTIAPPHPLTLAVLMAVQNGSATPADILPPGALTATYGGAQ